MGVYIKGMEMPASGVYVLSVDNTGTEKTVFAIAERTRSGKIILRHVGEAVPVQQHGRLIDADAFFEKIPSGDIEHDEKISRTGAIADVCTWVLSAPTVIEAEEGE